MPSNNTKALIIITCLAFAAALISAYYLSPKTASELQKDAKQYYSLGYHLAQEGRFGTSGGLEVSRTPGYPVLLALSFSIFGYSLTYVIIIQAIFHVLTTIITLSLGLLCFPKEKPVVYLAASLYAIDPFSLRLVPQILSESQASLLLVLLVFTLYKVFTSDGRVDIWTVLAGILGALLTFTRPGYLYIVPFALISYILIFWLRNQIRAEVITRLFVVSLISFSILLPWSLRVYSLTGSYSMSGGGLLGVNLLIGSLSYRDLSKPLTQITGAEFPLLRKVQSEVVKSLDLKGLTHPQKTRVIDDAYAQRAHQEIWANPILYLRSCLIRAPKLWVSVYHPRLPTLILYGVAVVCISTLLLAAIGLRYMHLFSIETLILLLPIIYITSTHMFIHAEARFSAPGRPFLLLLTAKGIFMLYMEVYSRIYRSQ